MRERYLLGMTAVPFVVAALMPGGLLGGDEVTRFQDPAIVESSGLVALGDGTLVTTNDSGDSGRRLHRRPGHRRDPSTSRRGGPATPRTSRPWRPSATDRCGWATSATTAPTARRSP